MLPDTSTATGAVLEKELTQGQSMEFPSRMRPEPAVSIDIEPLPEDDSPSPGQRQQSTVGAYPIQGPGYALGNDAATVYIGEDEPSPRPSRRPPSPSPRPLEPQDTLLEAELVPDVEKGPTGQSLQNDDGDI